jgi:hypothetical protein
LGVGSTIAYGVTQGELAERARPTANPGHPPLSLLDGFRHRHRDLFGFRHRDLFGFRHRDLFGDRDVGTPVGTSSQKNPRLAGVFESRRAHTDRCRSLRNRQISEG